jgi:DNA helicase-2/ATP-dependent DNA helicase PcrA
VRDTFRYFVVDEFQDVSPLQKLLLEAWLGDRDDICVVGDPHQTIYTFAGATSSYLAGFATEFPRAAVVRLVRDYRSTPQVVAVANQLIKATTPLVAQRKPGPSPLLTQFNDEVDEASGVAVQVRALLAGGVSAREVAILVRINAQSERFESALNDARVPYVVRGAERFYDRPVVKQALVLMRGAARGASAGPDPLPEAVRHILTSMGFTPLASHGSAGSGAEARERWESLAAIAQLADDMHADRPEVTLADFAAELTQRAELGHAPVVDGVTITTMHAAKGLEWDAVFLPALVEGMVPIVHARTPQAVDEERRLLYVAVTRARQHLYLSWAPARAPGNRSTRERSQFLRDLRLGGRRG